jgi:molybdate transport system substrate-binding protein
MPRRCRATDRDCATNPALSALWPEPIVRRKTGGALRARRINLERRFPDAVVSNPMSGVSRRAFLRARLNHWRTVVLERRSFLAAGVAAIALAAVPCAAQAQNRSITVFAAASMKNALDDVDAAFSKQSGIQVVASYDASSALMKQIEGGAPADVFVSADLKWMDYGSQKNLIKNDTRVNLLGNALVLIASKTSNIDHVDIVPGFDLAKLAGDGRIATGDVQAVPVGIYAKAALEKLGVWAAVEPKMAMAANVRAALILVARGEAPLGIVYATDARVEPGVKVVGVFPESSHDPIIYPVAATVNAKPDVAPYLAFLRSPAAKTIFESYGFTVLVSGS